MTLLLPELLYHNGAFRPGLALEFDERAGRITRIANAAEVEDPTKAVNLPRRALMPGFVNAHSHAFQRLIRGHTHWRPHDDSVSDFWSWREAMYAAALSLTPNEVYDVSKFCFIEMLRAGITTVGEFHYLHNDEDGQPYADRAELARRVIAAATDVGIRIRLLNVCYATGAIGEPLRAEQRRFATLDLDEYLDTTESLGSDVADQPLVTVGIAPHSIRAVPRAWLCPLRDAAHAHDLPLHMHVSEQTAEIDACVAEYGERPVELLAHEGLLDERFTAIHATHIDDVEVRLLGSSGATVCACPATERDLGDGFLRAADLLAAGASITLGSDSQTVIDMLEEARLTEYSERLRQRQRVVLTDDAASEHGAPREVAPVLMRMATEAGARSLRLPTGTLEAGALADFVAVDLDHHTLAGSTPTSLGAHLMLSAPADVVSDVWVGGRAVVTGGQHTAQEQSMNTFTRVARRFAGA